MTSRSFGVRLRSLVLGARAAPSSGAIDRALERLRAPGTPLAPRTARSGSRPRSSAMRRIASWCARTASTTYFASDIAYHLDKRERGFARLHRRARRGSSRLRGAGARRAHRRMGEPGESLEVTADPVREPVPRRRKDPDGQARSAVRHAAAAARGSRQRRLPLLLSDAQPRPAAGLRSGAGQVAQQRKPGVLHPVRPRARRERHEAAGRAAASRSTGPQGLAQRDRRWPARTSRRWCRRCRATRKLSRARRRKRAPHTLVYYLRELANVFHTYYNAEQFIVEAAPLRNARLALVRRRAAGDPQRPDAAGRIAPESM